MKNYAGKMAVVRGAGDLATGVIQKLARSGFYVLALEVEQPLTIRRSVALSQSVVLGETQVEDIRSERIGSLTECLEKWQNNIVPILVDPKATCVHTLRPAVLVDAIIAKRNTGTHRSMAPITVALGPGFSAPEDVDAVIETLRGHNLGKLITKGRALPDTKTPGNIGGKTIERVLHAPVAGSLCHIRSIGDYVQKGEPLFKVGEETVVSPLTGILRGLITDGIEVTKGLKVADVDPRNPDEVQCDTISDKARALGGAVLEACLYIARQKKLPLKLTE